MQRIKLNLLRCKTFSIATSAILLVAAYGHPVEARANKHGINPFRGLASWYGNKFQGKRTASGKPFNQNDFTCAHRTLPFGTKLHIENPDNGNECTVEVTDRGPFKGNRVVDLSKAAARKLGINGVGRVVCSTGRAFVRGVTPGDQSRGRNLTASSRSASASPTD